MRCCYCGSEIKSILDSNNPYDGSPDFYEKYSEEARCCSACNDTIVIPNRIHYLMKGGRENAEK